MLLGMLRWPQRLSEASWQTQSHPFSLSPQVCTLEAPGPTEGLMGDRRDWVALEPRASHSLPPLAAH